MKTKFDMPCICGHLFKNHLSLDLEDRRRRAYVLVCGMCENEAWIHNFKLDNLKYLEQKYERTES